MKTLQKFLAIGVLSIALISFSGCKQETTSDTQVNRSRTTIDDAADKIDAAGDVIDAEGDIIDAAGDLVDDAGDFVDDAADFVDDAADGMEDAADDIDAADSMDETTEPDDPLTAGFDEFDGYWEGRAEVASDTGVDDTACKGAKVGFDVEGYEFNGLAWSDHGFTLKVQGSFDETGIIFGAIAEGSVDTSTITGQFMTDKATGSWLDVYGCYGTFELIPAEKPTEFDTTLEELIRAAAAVIDSGGEVIDAAAVVIDEAAEGALEDTADALNDAADALDDIEIDISF